LLKRNKWKKRAIKSNLLYLAIRRKSRTKTKKVNTLDLDLETVSKKKGIIKNFSRSRSHRRDKSSRKDKKHHDSPKKSKRPNCRFDSPPKDYKKDQDILQTLGLFLILGGGMPFLNNPMFGGDLM
jgi:hypothetical protein